VDQAPLIDQHRLGAVDRNLGARVGTSLTAIAALGWRHVATVTGTTLVILAAVTAGRCCCGERNACGERCTASCVVVGMLVANETRRRDRGVMNSSMRLPGNSAIGETTTMCARHCIAVQERLARIIEAADGNADVGTFDEVVGQRACRTCRKKWRSPGSMSEMTPAHRASSAKPVSSPVRCHDRPPDAFWHIDSGKR